jgi:hypothetical protein
MILAEDKQQRTFAERLLKELSYKNKLRSLGLPAGQGSGEQHVRQQYAHEVGELRRRSGHLQLALVVVIDADSREIDERQRQLADELESASLQPRSADERIVHLIPRRNIETWIEYLLGRPVNETDTYQRLTGRERDCQPAVRRLVELYRSTQPPPTGCPPSLAVAIEELRHLGSDLQAPGESSKKGRRPRRKR